MLRRTGLVLLLSCAAAAPAAVRVTPAAIPPHARALPLRIGGRTVEETGTDGPAYRRQWPGTYFEAAFRGARAFFALGSGDTRLQVQVDGEQVATLVRPQPGGYLVDGLSAGDHRLRIDIASESQEGSSVFGGFRAPPGTVPRPLPHRLRRIEFIGDSHTVGYGNTHDGQSCTREEVWATTDTPNGLAGQLARRYDADYRVDAISGRGIVRNYGGFVADTLPVAYPYLLLDHTHLDSGAGWHPQVIVIALGTNDFTTPLHAGERWPDRAALHADFEASYVGFVRQLRVRHPRALILLWATDMADGEIEAEAAKVADRLHAAGQRNLAYLRIDGLAFSGCDHHPSLADDAVIAARLAARIDAQEDAWLSRR